MGQGCGGEERGAYPRKHAQTVTPHLEVRLKLSTAHLDGDNIQVVGTESKRSWYYSEVQLGISFEEEATTISICLFRIRQG
jgi:hypothetical protein